MRNEGNVLAPMRPQDASIQLVMQPRDLIVTFFGDHEHVRAPVNDSGFHATLAEPCLNSLDDLSAGWKHAECRERTCVDNGLAVDEDLEFTVTSLHHVDVRSQFATEARRHTDGVQA